MKTYHVKYTIRDGEYEYGDHAIFKTDLTPGTAEFDTAFFDTFYEGGYEWSESEKAYVLGAYRHIWVDSTTIVPDEDYEVLKKYL